MTLLVYVSYAVFILIVCPKTYQEAMENNWFGMMARTYHPYSPVSPFYLVYFTCFLNLKVMFLAKVANSPVGCLELMAT